MSYFPSTNANTALTEVKRDSSGNFSAGTITAALTGNASTVTNGVYTTGSYNDPSWITFLAGSKISGPVAQSDGIGTTTITTNTSFYPLFVTNNGTFYQTVGVNGSLNYNPSTGTLTATAFSGTTTNATNTAITDDTTTNATMYPTWVTANTGNLPQKVTSTKLSFNPTTGVLSSTSFTGAGTGLTGTASSLTAGNVTTNANLTGVITSAGNATSIASQTGTGSKFVVDTSPTLVTPLLGTPTSGTLTNCTNFPAGSLSGATLASGVTASSLTSVGTLANLTVTNPISGSITGNAGTVTNGIYSTDTGTVTNAMLGGSIANTKLSNSSVTVNGTSISLGASGTVTAAAGTLTGVTLNSGVTASSLTSVGILAGVTVSNSGATLQNSTASYSPTVLNYYEHNVSSTVTTSGSTAASFTARFTRIGNIVFMTWTDFTWSVSSGGQLTCSAIVPARFRPTSTINLNYFMQNFTANSVSALNVNSSGTVVFGANAPGGSFSSGTSTYAVYGGCVSWLII